jgi:hypothetical protein
MRDKGPVERFFRTLREDLLQALPGYKGPDIFSRGDAPATVTLLAHVRPHMVGRTARRSRPSGMGWVVALLLRGRWREPASAFDADAQHGPGRVVAAAVAG